MSLKSLFYHCPKELESKDCRVILRNLNPDTVSSDQSSNHSAKRNMFLRVIEVITKT